MNQSFNETRAVDIKVLTSDLLVLSMTLREFNIAEGLGTVGARIYDAGTGTLIAFANAAVGPGSDQSITIPIAALLQLGRTYRVGFFISAGCCAGSGDFIDADPPGLALTPYRDLTRTVEVTAAWAVGADAFPTITNSFVPLMAIEVEPAPAAVALDHFKCYGVRPLRNFTPVIATLSDQFEEKQVVVRGPIALCNPVRKCVGEACTDVTHPEEHLVCYTTEHQRGDRFEPRDVLVSNQFGDQPLRVLARGVLCAPSKKSPLRRE